MAPTLIVLNGPPAAGKSTVAERLVSDRPLSLRLDIDELRDLLGGWRDKADAAGLLARALASAMVRTHMLSGHDVVIAQLYGHADHLIELEAVASECGGRFREVVLMVDLEIARSRFVRRGGPRLAEVVASPGGLSMVDELHRRVTKFLGVRPGAIVIDATKLSPDDAYAAVVAAVTAMPQA